jgi:Skp family chaperone for outer membrane proteins
MKKAAVVLIVALVLAPGICEADGALYLNAFGETATAYVNDAFLLLGVVADAFVADIIQKNDALEIVQDVQKRLRRIRAKIRSVSQTQISESDRRLMDLLDKAYACLDHQAWALMQYTNEKTPETARRFNDQRKECLERIQQIGQFFAKLPPPAQVSEPLSTR